MERIKLKSKLLKYDKRPSCIECKNNTAVYNPVFGTERYCHSCEFNAVFDYFYPRCHCCDERVELSDYIPDVERYKPAKNILIDGKQQQFARYVEYPEQDKEGNLICESCYHDDQQEPKSTITNLATGEVIKVCEYSNFNQDGEEVCDLGFNINWQTSGGYRGEYVVTSDTKSEIHDDGILSMSEDEQNLKIFDDVVKKLLVDSKITVYQVISRSSNLFYCPYSLWIENEDLEKFDKLKPKINQLKHELRKDEDYSRTVWSGE